MRTNNPVSLFANQRLKESAKNKIKLMECTDNTNNPVMLGC